MVIKRPDQTKQVRDGQITLAKRQTTECSVLPGLFAGAMVNAV